MIPDRDYRDWPMQGANILIITCMKNEGPFILEWIVWHKAIGVNDFVAYTNDCSDGTVEILDRLQQLGRITHLENPAVARSSTYFQPEALNALHQRPEFIKADFVISLDVDDFINIQCGDGTLPALFETVGFFDVLSMSELNHGSNRIEAFVPGWVTEQFPKHQTQTPGRWKSERGVKSITRLSEKVDRIRNHRPNVEADALWVDGAGRPTQTLKEDPKNGLSEKGSYKHLVLDHFPLLSLQSYLIKMDRGDVVIKGKMVSQRYWCLRNVNSHLTSDLTTGVACARAYFDAHFAPDAELMALQRRADTAHAARIADIVDDDLFRERREWIFKN